MLLHPKEQRLEIVVPVRTRIRQYLEHTFHVGVATGITVMLTTDSSSIYGQRLGELVKEHADWIQEQTSIYQRNKDDNPSRKNYLRLS